MCRRRLKISLDDFTRLEGLIRVCINKDGSSYGVVASQTDVYCTATTRFKCPFQRGHDGPSEYDICTKHNFYVLIKE